MATGGGRAIHADFLITRACKQDSVVEKELWLGKHWDSHLKYISHPPAVGSKVKSISPQEKKKKG